MKKKFSRILSVVLAVMMLISAAPLAADAQTVTDGYLTFEVYENWAELTDVDEAFSGDLVLPSFINGTLVESIGFDALDGCTGITSITIPASMPWFDADLPSGVSAIYVEDGHPEYYSVDGVLYDSFFSELVLYPPAKSDEAFTVPAGIYSIGYGAFENCTHLKSITLPDSVTYVGTSAFAGCVNLETINASDNLRTITYNSVYSTKFYNDSANWEDDALYIGKCLVQVKASREGTAFTVKPGTKTISDYAFDGCENLESVVIPDSVTTIGYSAFRDCSSLKDISLPDTAELYISDDAFYRTAFYNDSSNWENGILYLGTHIIAVDTDVVSGDVVIKPGTKTMVASAFAYAQGITSVSIPGSVGYIDASSFEGCKNLEAVTIGYGVEDIHGNVFSGCSALKEITIPGSVTVISYGAFRDCVSLEKVVLGEGVKQLDTEAFEGCNKLSDITIPDSLVSIGEKALQAPLKSFHIGKNLKRITGPLTYYNGFEGYTIDEENKYFSVDEYGVLYNKDKTVLLHCPYNEKLTEYTVADTVTEIGAKAFHYNYGLKKVILPDGLKKIGQYAFYGCTQLEYLNIPKGLEEISFSSLYMCSALKSYIIPENCVIVNSDNIVGDDEFLWMYMYINSQAFFTDEITVYDKDFDFAYYLPVIYSRIFPVKDGCFEKLRTAWVDGFTGMIEAEASFADEYAGYPSVDDYLDYSISPDYVVDNVLGGSIECWINTEITIRCYKGSTSEDFAQLHHLKVKYICDSHIETEVKGYAATCENSGLTDGVICSECEEQIVPQEIIPAKGHSYNAVVTPPTCTQSGYTTYTCECSATYTADKVPALKHADNDEDHFCDFCEEEIIIKDNNNDSAENKCSHICHKTGFLSIFAKIAVFFWKLFNINPVCSCGVAHY